MSSSIIKYFYTNLQQASIALHNALDWSKFEFRIINGLVIHKPKNITMNIIFPLVKSLNHMVVGNSVRTDNLKMPK